jgi:hypothetical protein
MALESKSPRQGTEAVRYQGLHGPSSIATYSHNPRHVSYDRSILYHRLPLMSSQVDCAFTAAAKSVIATCCERSAATQRSNLPLAGVVVQPAPGPARPSACLILTLPSGLRTTTAASARVIRFSFYSPTRSSRICAALDSSLKSSTSSPLIVSCFHLFQEVSYWSLRGCLVPSQRALG